MFKKLALMFFLFLISLGAYLIVLSPTKAADEKPFPKIWLPCDEDRNIEFHSLRPYQAAPCGEANKALYCSNDLIFNESFDMEGKKDCTMKLRGPGEITFTCYPDHHVYPHTLYVKLDNSDFPIMGNTEDVKNSKNSSETLDDAAKVNEYVSWYLSGVNTRAEYGTPTEDQVVNYSGPVQKLLPSIIADAQRSTVIKNVLDNKSTNHNQTVVCATKPVQLLPSWLTNIFDLPAVGIGTAKAVPCYDGGGSIYKLKNWDQSFIGVAKDLIKPYLDKILSVNYATSFISSALVDRWNKKIPPLPWDDGTGKPFETSDKYQKAYNEWRGDLCAFLPNPFSSKEYLACVKIPGVTNNEFADLFQYVPLAETPDKAGSESIIGVSIEPDGGTKVNVVNWGKKVDPPLFFAHTEEVKQLSETLNKTYMPKDVQSVPVPESTEKNVCSVVNVRANAGDNLFPGDEDELQLQNVEYYITEATCHEVWTRREWEDEFGKKHFDDNHTIECPAEVTITIKTNTMTPSANEIFSTTVADSMSTFRKIYPKVEAGAPVSCIADIPTVTNVDYDPLINKRPGSQSPNEGALSFRVDNKPSDGGNATPQLTFPHIGSVYEYFLKGIQTALRPQGYADPNPISGNLCQTTSQANLGDICAVADAYGIPCCQLKGIAALETGSGAGVGNGSCSTKNGTFSCCNGGMCGPSQIACGQYDAFTGNDNIDMCDSAGSAELLARAMLLKLCQADGKCNSYDWNTWGNYVKENYSVGDGDYTAAAYFYGLANDCTVTACSQYRWGAGKSYCDAVKSYCETGSILTSNTSKQFCDKCNEEIIRAGQTPINCN